MGYGWSGGWATLDWQPLSSRSGLVSKGVGNHTLVVDGQNASDQIANGAEPAAKLTKRLSEIAETETSILALVPAFSQLGAPASE